MLPRVLPTILGKVICLLVIDILMANILGASATSEVSTEIYSICTSSTIVSMDAVCVCVCVCKLVGKGKRISLKSGVVWTDLSPK